jgi:TolB-like protein/class 3 adenylate cyclase/Tfp pilus assembly protein PilF
VPDVPPSAKQETNLQLEIAHLLLIDIVSYSRLLVDEQITAVQQLNAVVRSTEAFRAAEKRGQLIRVPTGDGLALVFFRSPEEPARCALEIAEELRHTGAFELRMGIHSGPVNQVRDVNDSVNVAGAGINLAQRIMDCGDAGHILLSKRVAEDLAEYRQWQPYLHDLGQCEVKHGLRLHIFNFHKEGVGNPGCPQKLKRAKRWKPASLAVRRAFPAPSALKTGLVALACLFVVAGLVSALIFLKRTHALLSAGAIPEKSIAVLPFQNLSDDRQNAYFADGVQDEILTYLAKVADLKVISRTSVMQYKGGGERNVRQIAQALGVAYVLEGSVQRANGRVRMNAQLIDARSDAHVWAESYDRKLADVFTIQSEIAEQIASQLRARISPQEKAAMEQWPTADLDAYDLYVRAKAFVDAINFSERASENLLQAVQLLEDAVGRDPKFLRAYQQLARAHDLIYFLGIDHTPARIALAEAAVQNALRIQPDSAEAHLALGQHLYWAYRDYNGARKELALARRALPNEPLVLIVSSLIDRRQGRWGESIQELERALELDPRNIFILQQLSFSYEYTRRFAEMAAVLDRVLKIAPKDANTRVQRAIVELESRADLRPLRSTIEAVVAEERNAAATISDRWILVALFDRDKAELERALSSVPPEGFRSTSVTFPRAWCQGVIARATGDDAGARAAFTQARAELEKILREQPDYAEQLSVLGITEAALGRKEEAIRQGRRAVELLPVTKDAITGALVLEHLAVIYAWTGEKNLALDQLEQAARIPSEVNYGQLRLHPYWDPLRGQARFEKIVASLAPAPEKL